MAHVPYRLRCQLYGHEQDVRSVSTITEYDGLVSGSRDRTARIWRPSDQNSFEQRALLKDHTNFVIATCYVPANGAFPDGLIATGGNDKKIFVYSAKQGTHLFTLEGHTETVSSLSYVTQTDLLLSTSWDLSARVWSLSTQQCVQVLTGHTKAVWTVISMDDPRSGSKIIITGAADNLIMAWKDQQVVRTYEGHRGCVRSLAVLNAEEFLSSGNDNTIKRWNFHTGQCLQTYEDHTNFVYSVTVINPERFASISEDRSLRIWSIHNGTAVQTVRLPSSTVWCVTSLTNGDVAVACSDGRICLFTQDESRTANAKEIAAFEEELAATTIQTKTGDLGEVKIDDLPTEEALAKPGARDGQTTMINKGNGHVEAYQWSMAEERWMKIGDVVGSADGTAKGQASATGEKILFEGKYYDYVFNVALDDENQLKLPFNVTDDPWFSAQEFIHRHELSQLFLDQIAQFIIKNTEGMVIDQRAADYADPFTGGGRYVPGQGASGQGGSQSNYDPFTGAGRYVPDGRSAVAKPTPSANQDPFTGAGRYVPNGGGAANQDAAARPLSASQSAVAKTDKDTELTIKFPQTQYVTMGNADPAKILGKLKEFNDSASGDGLRLSDAQLQEIQDLVNGNTNNLDAKLNLLLQLLKWPVEKIFPILDIIRLIVLNGDICKTLLENESKASQLINELLTHLRAEQAANTMLISRALTNLFSNELGEKYLVKQSHSIIPKTLICLPVSKKNAQAALTSVILNYCINAYRNNDQSLSSYLYDCYREFVDIQLESDGAKRLILGLGTLFYTNADLVLNVRTTNDNSAKGFFTVLEKSASQFTDDTLQCLEQCRQLITNL